MSSTKRGGQRRPDDFYRTPRWAIDALLYTIWGVKGPILDPGCGDGAILAALQDHGYPDTIGVELDAGRAEAAAPFCRQLLVGDLLTLDLTHLNAGTVIGNPPYALAQEFVEHALRTVQPGGKVYMLLRLAFLAGQKRARSGLWSHLDAVHILSRRPAFTAKGTDSADYAWIVWRRPQHAQEVRWPEDKKVSLQIIHPDPQDARATGHLSQQTVTSAHE